MDAALDQYKFDEQFTSTAAVSTVAHSREHNSVGHFGLAFTIFTLLALAIFFAMHYCRARRRARRYMESLPTMNQRVVYNATPRNRR